MDLRTIGRKLRGKAQAPAQRAGSENSGGRDGNRPYSEGKPCSDGARSPFITGGGADAAGTWVYSNAEYRRILGSSPLVCPDEVESRCILTNRARMQPAWRDFCRGRPLPISLSPPWMTAEFRHFRKQVVARGRRLGWIGHDYTTSTDLVDPLADFTCGIGGKHGSAYFAQAPIGVTLATRIAAARDAALQPRVSTMLGIRLRRTRGVTEEMTIGDPQRPRRYRTRIGRTRAREGESNRRSEKRTSAGREAPLGSDKGERRGSAEGDASREYSSSSWRELSGPQGSAESSNGCTSNHDRCAPGRHGPKSRPMCYAQGRQI